MKLKRKTFKNTIQILILSTFFLIPSAMFGQNDSRLHKILKYRPDHYKLQFSGGTAFLSAGVGYSLFKEHLDITGYYGYVPKSVSLDDLHSFTLRFTVKTIHCNITENTEIMPLNIGMLMHHTFGNEYWVKLPDHYPKDYYWWSPGRNFGVFFGGEIRTKIKKENAFIDKVGVYYGVGTGILYITSAFGNSTIDITDILRLGVGIVIYR
ncbi:MAG: hypothetical protein U9R32_10885 [Bacteroidota bacterium]|nr:hypothetical protein [Bacteroidota bacterium]